MMCVVPKGRQFSWGHSWCWELWEQAASLWSWGLLPGPPVLPRPPAVGVSAPGGSCWSLSRTSGVGSRRELVLRATGGVRRS